MACSDDLVLDVSPRYLIQHFIPIVLIQIHRKTINIVFIEEVVNFEGNIISIGSEKDHAVSIMITMSVISQFLRLLGILLLDLGRG